MTKITDGNNSAPILRCGNYQNYMIKAVRALHPHASPNWELEGEPVVAHVNWGRWIAICPDCAKRGSIQIFYVVEGKAFFCAGCLNGLNDGKGRPVKFPEERQEIERLLCKRRHIGNRNFYPEKGDTLAVVKAENIIHGDGI